MPRYVAFLRGVSPQNAKMPELKHCFEAAGFVDVKTVLSSGNVVFDAGPAKLATLEQQAQASMQALLGRSFYTVVRRAADLRALLLTDPYRAFDVPPHAKRVVSFFRDAPRSAVSLPLQADGAQLLCVLGREAFTAYVPSEKGPVFMSLIGQAFGTDVTTRTWASVGKCVVA